VTTILCFGQPIDVLTNRYDSARTGSNVNETVLHTQNVNVAKFGKLFEREVDGDMYAQPLIKTSVSIPGVGVRNVVYVATVNNSLYAFDADAPGAGKPFWRKSREVFGDPVPKDEVTDLPKDQKYLNFETTVGIVATPVIDADTSTIYVVANSKKGGDYSFRIHAFDLATGREKTELNSPATVTATTVGNGVGNVDGRIAFKPRKMLNRPGLLLVDGVLYLAFTSHLDGEPLFDYHGWIMAYDAHSLKQISVFCTTPDGIQGGIWQSGAGLAAEEREGTFPLIYAAIANGSSNGRNFGESIAQLFPGRLLSLKQALMAPEHVYLNDHDLDLSTGPVLIPGVPLVIACDKAGDCYLADRTDMHLTQKFAASFNSYGGERPPNIHGAPVVWWDANNLLHLYVWGEEDFPRHWAYDGRRFQASGKGNIKAPEMSMPGGILSLSANGRSLTSAVLWASVPLSGDANLGTVAGVLRAFDALDLRKELWNSEQNAGRDRVGMFAKFCPPVVANGKVYLATFADKSGRGNKLAVYGLLNAN
jgi:outer membrane protein assembly factor BamB